MEENNRETAQSFRNEEANADGEVKTPHQTTKHGEEEPISVMPHTGGVAGVDRGETVGQSAFAAHEASPQDPEITHPESEARPTNSLSTAGLVCGIIAVVLAMIPGLNFFIGSILGILATVFGAVAKKQDGSGKAGLILGSISLAIIAAWFIVFLIVAVIAGETDPLTF